MAPVCCSRATETLGQTVAVLDSRGQALAMNSDFTRLLDAGWFTQDRMD